MKKWLFVLFFGGGLLFLMLSYQSWPVFGEQETEAKLSEAIDLIDIDISGASTTILPTKQDSLSVELDGKGKVSLEEDKDSIKIEFKDDRWFNFLHLFGKSHLTIYLPEEYHNDLSLEIGSGSVKMNESEVELKTLEVEVSSGHIELAHLKADTFHVAGSSGNIQVDNVATEMGTIKMKSGNVDVKDYSGGLIADLSSGKLEVEFTSLTDDIELGVKSGYALLDLPQHANFTIDADIGSGTITTNFNLKDSEEDKHSFWGTHGTGEHEIKVDVSSGKVKIQ
ncbi:DUF4097 family beta strand repeat-containing protein [Bacillus weihaiensis]|uniref:DUF4097 family beta strand repeat-containing protein n=1 Tax=Bacillus weihaiensis TaxID=1547283 RepID=UPI002355A576|nr:DUF4097 family beta strand repeat-containing protein [Bacillus weihaiensis]